MADNEVAGEEFRVCKNCRFSHDIYNGFLECRRRSPVMGTHGQGRDFPIVGMRCWCGEWELKQ